MTRNVRFSLALAVTAFTLQACAASVGTVAATPRAPSTTSTAPNTTPGTTIGAPSGGTIVGTGSGNIVGNGGAGVATGKSSDSAQIAPRPAASAAPAASNASNSQTTLPGAMPPPQQQQVDLKAGSIDDNAKYTDYLSYLSAYKGSPMRPYDVSERHVIVVKDANGLPVANTKVTVAAGDTVVFTGKTYANGQLLFHPKATPGADLGSRFFVTVGDNTNSSAGFARTLDGPWEIKLTAPVPKAAPKLDLQIVLDTTGSMGGEIKRLQTTIDSIASRIQGLPQQPVVRYGIVAFKDRLESSYLTKKQDFTGSVNDFRVFLDTLEASGGGDVPEDHETALSEALGQSWDATAPIRLSMMITDAVPHIDYNPTVKYTDSIVKAQGMGVKFFTIGASGLTPDGEFFMRQMAQATMGQYLFITRGGDEQSGGGEVSGTVSQFSEGRLDDLMVNIVKNELNALGGQ